MLSPKDEFDEDKFQMCTPHIRGRGMGNWHPAITKEQFRADLRRYGHGTTLPASLCDGQCTELMAGRAAERMLLSDSEPVPPVDDLRQARELAMLICTSEEAIETFIAHCDVAARDLLLPYGDVVMTLSIVLRIKRTLDSDEIDKIISDLQAHKALAIERGRRQRWQRVTENAAAFNHS
jgi:hypothetical protein